MIKSLLFLTLFTSFSFAGLLNAIAFTVNGEPITLYDIDQLKSQQKISEKQAAIELFKTVITKELAKEKNIVIDKVIITQYIDGIMKRNGLDRKSFEQNLKIEGLTYDEYFEQIKLQHIQQRLMGMLTYGKITDPTLQEKQNFFEQHLNDFSTPEEIKVIEYTSENQSSLINKQRSPMFVPTDITQTDKSIKPQSINPKLAQLLLSTKTNSYTKIFQSSATSFTMFYVKSFGKRVTPDFKDVEKQLEKTMLSMKKNTLINNIFQDAMRASTVNYIKIEPLEL